MELQATQHERSQLRIQCEASQKLIGQMQARLDALKPSGAAQPAAAAGTLAAGTAQIAEGTADAPHVTLVGPDQELLQVHRSPQRHVSHAARDA